MAFAHHRSELAKKMDVSHGLLDILLDKDIITQSHYEAIKVSVLVFVLLFMSLMHQIHRLCSYCYGYNTVQYYL